LITLAVVLALGICGALFLLPSPQLKVDVVEINDVTARLSDHFDQLSSSDYLLPKSNYDYTVVDTEGNVLRATRQGLSQEVFAAIRHGDIMVDISHDGQVVGKVFFYNDMEAQWQAYRNNLQVLVIVVMVALAVISVIFFAVINRQILQPFQRMRGFAQRVAAGELDAPLEMDKRNVFGAFTESFDLMRDELRRARENEQAAEQSKRELVASLSHDIQTPISSIKAVAEVMEITADEVQAQKLKTIQDKASQIQTLVTELFHTTLEELDKLNVQPMSVPSSSLLEIIRASEYLGRVKMGEIPGCLVQADPVRMPQVMDNVIANSYKYADTEIDVSAELLADFLLLTLRDWGPGVAEEELPRLCIKYFRGTSSEGKNGYGLGLFIASHLIERMGGQLECCNAQPGFAVKIWLKLDS